MAETGACLICGSDKASISSCGRDVVQFRCTCISPRGTYLTAELYAALGALDLTHDQREKIRMAVIMYEVMHSLGTISKPIDLAHMQCHFPKAEP